jgi:hypothetical protein
VRWCATGRLTAVSSRFGAFTAPQRARARATLDRLLDLGAGRIADMDATGIDKAVLALTSPGVQAYTDAEEARLTPRRPTICWPRLARTPPATSA